MSAELSDLVGSSTPEVEAATGPAPDWSSSEASRLRAQVEAFVPRTEREASSRQRFLEELAHLERPFDRSAGPVHVTASALVLGPRGTVLHVHRRLGRWLQPGGHVSPGEAPAQAALREAVEETGLPLSHPAGGPRLLHLDVHPGPDDHLHLDLRYLLVSQDAEPRPGEGESTRVAWFGFEEAFAVAGPGLVDGLSRLREVQAEGPWAPVGGAPATSADRPVDAVVFDFDGVLLDTEEPEYLAWRAIWAEHGVELDLVSWSACIGTAQGPTTFDPYAELCRHVRPAQSQDDIVARRRRLAAELVAGRPPMAGVLEWLDEAQREGVAVAVASSSPRSWVEGHLERIGLRDRFGILACYDDCGAKKPDPASYLLACRALGVAPERALAVEDSRNGLLAAKAAGLGCVVVPNKMTAHMDLSEADLRLSSLGELGLLATARLVTGSSS